MHVILLFALLIQHILLLVQSFLKSGLVLLEAASPDHVFVLLVLMLQEDVILHE